MGCDIHMYVEYKRKEDKEFRGFAGRINPGRNYYMFGILCKGVRFDNEKGFEPKGLPDYQTLAYDSRNDVQDCISDSADGNNGYVTPERAAESVEKGYTKYTDERKVFVFNSDWHSHSWLTLSEYSQALLIYNEHPESSKYKEPEYEAILAVLNCFENQGFETRIVFWFDN